MPQRQPASAALMVSLSQACSTVGWFGMIILNHPKWSIILNGDEPCRFSTKKKLGGKEARMIPLWLGWFSLPKCFLARIGSRTELSKHLLDGSAWNFSARLFCTSTFSKNHRISTIRLQMRAPDASTRSGTELVRHRISLPLQWPIGLVPKPVEQKQKKILS